MNDGMMDNSNDMLAKLAKFGMCSKTRKWRDTVRTPFRRITLSVPKKTVGKRHNTVTHILTVMRE